MVSGGSPTHTFQKKKLFKNGSFLATAKGAQKTWTCWGQQLPQALWGSQLLRPLFELVGDGPIGSFRKNCSHAGEEELRESSLLLS